MPPNVNQKDVKTVTRIITTDNQCKLLTATVVRINYAALKINTNIKLGSTDTT
jgi:hypothetical protein